MLPVHNGQSQFSCNEACMIVDQNTSTKSDRSPATAFINEGFLDLDQSNDLLSLL